MQRERTLAASRSRRATCAATGSLIFTRQVEPRPSGSCATGSARRYPGNADCKPSKR
jgi:hypothetical protein